MHYLHGGTVRHDEETALRAFTDALSPGELRGAMLEVLDALRDHRSITMMESSEEPAVPCCCGEC